MEEKTTSGLIKYSANNLKEAKKLLKELFNKSIIHNLHKDWKDFVIEIIEAEEFYKGAIESQQELKDYLSFMEKELDRLDRVEKETLIDRGEEKEKEKKKAEKELKKKMENN